MRKALITIVVLALLGLAAWVYFGGIERVTEGRVRNALTDQGVPPELADCMAGRMVERLTISQLRSLEDLQAREGERAIPLSLGEVLDRVRRVDDPEAVEVSLRAAASCSFGIAL